MRRTRLPVLALALGTVLLPLAGCGNEGDGSTGGHDAGAVATAGTQLTVSVTPSKGATPRTWTLTCDPPDGSHPRAKQACAALDTARKPFAAVPDDMACTEIFGGPQVATVRGTWEGARVDAHFSRENGCEIDRWDHMGAVFPVKVGA